MNSDQRWSDQHRSQRLQIVGDTWTYNCSCGYEHGRAIAWGENDKDAKELFRAIAQHDCKLLGQKTRNGSEKPWANRDKAIEIIKQHGIDGLGGLDGCTCMSFRVQGIDVHISCWKSNREISLKADEEDNEASLKPVADALMESLSKVVGYDARAEGFTVRYGHDQPTGDT